MNNNTNTTPPNGYKKTTIGIIPENWEVKKLGDLAINKNSSLSINKLEGNFGDYPLYGAGKIIQSIDFYEQKERYISIIKDGAGVGRVLKCLPFSSVVGTMSYVFAKQNTDFDYLFYTLQSISFDKYITGSTIPHVYFKDYSNEKLPIPPLPEQQKIAEILSTWDDAIANCKTTINTLKARNKGLSQQLLTGNKRLNEFGDNWTTKKIKDFSLEISSKNKEDEDMIVLSCTKHNGLVPSLEYFGRKIYSDNLKTYKIVEKNVFAYATNHIEEGSIGYQSKYEKALISPMYTVFKTDDDINDEFLFRVLKSNTYIQEYQKRMEGSIDRRGGLRWQEFSKIKVNVPSYEEQTAIALALETATQELKSYQDKLEALQLQKKGLMQQLLTGKIRVNVK